MTTSDLRDVWTTWGKCNFIPRSTFISRDCAACKRFFLVFLGEAGFSPSSMNWMYEADLTWVWHFFRLSCYKMSASAQRTCSWCHLYLPWLSAVLHPARMCANVPLPPHRLHSESYLIHHLCRFVGVGRVSYIDRSRKEMRKGSSFQSSCHMIFLFGRSHLVQAPCDPSSTAFDHRLSSSRCQTSAWIISLLCLGSAFPHCWKWLVPSPCLPIHGFPMMSFNLSILSACATDVSAAHLCPDLVVIPVSLTFSSLESLYMITSLHFATLNSSTTDDRGGCKYPGLTYSPIDVKLGGIPSHLRRCLFTCLSTPSTDVIGTS